jgi:hypothetical protein
LSVVSFRKKEEKRRGEEERTPGPRHTLGESYQRPDISDQEAEI